MKILCHHENMASHFIYSGLGGALEKLGHQFNFWNDKQNSAFDIFNTINPDILLTQGYNLTRAEIKCINNRPDMKVLLKIGIDGDINELFDKNIYQSVFTSIQEHENVSYIKNPHRLFLFNYGFSRYEDLLIKNWKSVANTFMLPLAADKYRFYPDYNENVKSDIAFCGGYWEYKGRNINKYILPLCYPIGKYNIKIFGNQVWPCSQYNGMISDNTVRQVLSSAKIVPACHEPHANQFGYELESRVFNAITCKSLVISDNVESYKLDCFTNGELPMFDNQKEYHDCIDYYLSHEDERLELVEKQHKIVMANHTYDNRVQNILRMVYGN